MGADQTPDPTALDDDQLDNLLDALAERAKQRDDLGLPGGGASRRGVLAGLLGLGGAAAGAGVASAVGENESYGASTGVLGTDSEPLNEANVQDLHAQNAQLDNLESGQIDTGGTIHVAAHASGGDADARLDSVLSQASDGDRIILENATYTKDRSINEFELIIESTGQAAGAGATIDATWTIQQDRNHLRRVRIESTGSVIFDGADFGSYMSLSQIAGSVTIKPDNGNHLMFGVHGGGNVTFESGCTGSIIMATGNLTVTDNDGTNTVL